jgi:di/tripeptidase
MENKMVCDYVSLSFEELLGAQKDIERMQAGEAWSRFLEKIEDKETQMKEFLLHKAKASRDLFMRQGMYEGMTTYKEVIEQVENVLNYRKTQEPLFNQEMNDDDSPLENPGTDLVPTVGTSLVIRDGDLPVDDEEAQNDEEDPDFGDFPVEGDSDLE